MPPKKKNQIVEPIVEPNIQDKPINKKYPAKIVLSDSDSDDEPKIKLVNDLDNKTQNNLIENFEFTDNNSYREIVKLIQNETINVINSNNLNSINNLKNNINDISSDLYYKKTQLQNNIHEIFNTCELISESINLINNQLDCLTVEENKIIKSIQDNEKKLTQATIEVPKPIQTIKFNTISDLINAITNEHQKAILYRISSDSEYAKVYLQNFVVNNDKKKKTLKGTINILGNFNKSKGIREAYEVKVFENDPKGSFWCTCADHKFNSAKKNIVCKHICFIVCKVLKIMETYFFDTKTLKPEHLQQLIDKFSDNSDLWKDKQITRNSDVITISDFKKFPKPINDICTFCYDEMTDADIPVSCACPLCKHCFHEECMDVWLEVQSKCSYCSNEFWKYYKRIKAGEKQIHLPMNKL